MSEEFEIPDLDDLFDDQDGVSQPQNQKEPLKYLFLGRKKLFDRIYQTVTSFDNIEFEYTKKIDEAIELLLVDIYAVVMLDHELKNSDLITSSRIVRVNHPLARIIALSSSRKSLFIADIINHGSVDAYLPLPVDDHELITILSEQQAKHDIDKMLTKFVSKPPELSAASYLLLDPSLSVSEDEPAQFVGLMISYRSVPRFSSYFEDLLAKDEILFAGYLSGITMLGQELLQSEDPLKEINFGGISVIFRFHDELQFSIFVRNLSKHNVAAVEDVITQVVGRLLEETGSELASIRRPTNESLELMHEISSDFERANEIKKDKKERMKEALTLKGQIVMLYGTDEEEQRKIKKYLRNKAEYSIVSFTQEEDAKNFLYDNDISVLVLDSDLENTKGQGPLAFADFVRDDYPYTQVIYQMRDRRASGPIIRSLNSGAINYLISYRAARMDLEDWIRKGIEKAIEIREESEGQMDGGINSALVAKTKIRKDEFSYLTDDQPELEGIFITKEEIPVFKRFWEQAGGGYDDQMLAGLVASLESVSGEMFYDESNVGGIELEDSNLVVEHREDFNFIYFIKNLGSHNANVVSKYLKEFTDMLFEIIEDQKNHTSDSFQARLDTRSNNIYSDFNDYFTK